MKRALLAFTFVVATALPDFVSANPATDEERRLVSLAEEISASGMDDDEKIARLTEVEARVSRIRKDRSDSVGAQAATVKPSEIPKAVRPLSTYVEKQTRSALEGSSDEDEPAWLSKFFFAAVHYVGITLAIGVAVLIVSQTFIEALAFIERKFGWSILPSPRRTPMSAEIVQSPSNHVIPATSASVPNRQTFVTLVRKKCVVPRDGIVPPHLR